MKTVRALGADYPVIAAIEDGYVLAAHPNGPAIVSASSDTISVLEWQDHSVFPKRIHLQAISEYRKATWPLVKDHFCGGKP